MESDAITLPTSAFTRRVLLFGATGTAGQATTRALVRAGYQVTCVTRRATDTTCPNVDSNTVPITSGNASISCSTEKKDEHEHDCAAPFRTLIADASDPDSLQHTVFSGRQYDAVVSCMASRSGLAADAWAIDYRAHANILRLAKASGVKHLIYLSAICVQKPLLAFQHAKLAFEKDLIESGLTYSIVRPTAFFKSLSGQINRVKNGKAFLLFGDGSLTACKPISDNDLGCYITSCISNTDKHNRILPVGGPGEAITLREQGELLFSLLEEPPRFKKVPVALLSSIRWVLKVLGIFNKTCAKKAELASIGRYYATESMLVLNPETERYDAHLTPSTGTETLRDFYASVLEGTTSVNLGEHAVFKNKKNNKNS